MILTNRDLVLLAKLQTYGLLTTRLVGKQVFSGVNLTTVLRRLRKLESDSYVQRVTGLEGFELAWALTEKGVQKVGDVPFKRHFRRDLLEHDVKLTNLRLALEGQGIARHWTPEHEIRSIMARRHGLKSMTGRVVPDGLMGVRVDGCAETVAVELELNFKNQGRYYRTFREYRSKSNIWAVWYVVATPGMGESLARLWKKFNPLSGGLRFRWSLVDFVLTNPEEAWVHSQDHRWKLSDLWQQEVQNIPAQLPALEMSRERESENSEKTLQMAS